MNSTKTNWGIDPAPTAPPTTAIEVSDDTGYTTIEQWLNQGAVIACVFPGSVSIRKDGIRGVKVKFPDPVPPLLAPEAPKLVMARLVSRDYAACDFSEDAPLENGNYVNACYRCGVDFIGHKHRVICKVCAEKPTDTGIPASPAPVGSAVDALTAADLLDGSTCGELDCDTCNDQRELGARLLRTQAAKLTAAERRIAKLQDLVERFQGPEYAQARAALAATKEP